MKKFKEITFALVLSCALIFGQIAFATPSSSSEIKLYGKSGSDSSENAFINRGRPYLPMYLKSLTSVKTLLNCGSNTLADIVIRQDININDDVAIFKAGNGEEYILPIFFALLFLNDYQSLFLLLENPNFDIATIHRGMQILETYWTIGIWKMSLDVAIVLSNSNYKKYFVDFLSKIFLEKQDLSFDMSFTDTSISFEGFI